MKNKLSLGKGLGVLDMKDVAERKLPHELAEGTTERLFGELKEFLHWRFPATKRCSLSEYTYNGCLNFRTEDYTIMIRAEGHDREGLNAIIIAQLTFKEMRQGHGTAFVGTLCRFAKECGYGKIVIDSTNSNSAPFAAALGFNAVGNGNYISDL